MMSVHSNRVAKLLAAGVFVLSVSTAPLAYADNDAIPALEPAPVPVASQPGGTAGCAPGQSLDPSNGNCLPDMTSVGNTQGDDVTGDLQPRTTQDITSTTVTGVGADMVPNINGYPCSGYWESAACYAESQDEVAVQPKSTISSSP
jgi:hypothetical protein